MASLVQTVYDLALKKRESHDSFYRELYRDDLERLQTLGVAGLEGGAGDTAASEDGSWSSKVYTHLYSTFSRIFDQVRDGTPKRLLELGAGTGDLSSRMACPELKVSLVDNEPLAAAVARRVSELTGKADVVDVRCMDLFDLKDEEPYDIIFSIGLFEELDSAQRDRFLKLTYSLLKPGGLHLIAVPNFLSPAMISLWWKHGKANETFISQRRLRYLLRKTGYGQVRSAAAGVVIPNQKQYWADRHLMSFLGMLNVAWGTRPV